MDTLKEIMVTMLILVFVEWKKYFHVHEDASSIALGVVLFKPGECHIDHHIVFASQNFSKTKKTSTSI